MNVFEEALINELQSITEIGNRVYPSSAPEKVRNESVPYIILISSYGVKTKSLDGYRDGKRVPVELNVITTRYEQLKSITQKVMHLLENMEGRVIGLDGPFIQELTYLAPVEIYESAPKLHRCLIDFNVFFEEVE